MQHFKFVNWRIGEFDFWCHEQVIELQSQPEHITIIPYNYQLQTIITIHHGLKVLSSKFSPAFSCLVVGSNAFFHIVDFFVVFFADIFDTDIVSFLILLFCFYFSSLMIPCWVNLGHRISIFGCTYSAFNFIIFEINILWHKRTWFYFLKNDFNHVCHAQDWTVQNVTFFIFVLWKQIYQ